MRGLVAAFPSMRPGLSLSNRSWLHYYEQLPEDQRYRRIFTAWDTALKDGGKSDWTVCTVWLQLGNVYYLLHLERGLYGFSELRETFSKLNKDYKPFKILIEETTIGKSLKSARDLTGSYLIKLAPIEEDRVGRVYVLQSMFEEGLVRFPKNAPFMQQ